ncbi:GntR family transcriptional regulator [Micromonospora sp. NPDC005257]|uniref:GntR family transcriptional regulator n=1 Tax=Micromonospora sp. NPDC005257 TaxID=3364230 RepID=UPI0036C70EBB
MLDPLSPVPMYVQLADLIGKQIEAGKLPPRRPIPSESQLRGEYAVGRGTVRQAVALLRERGLVFTVPQRGTYVSGGEGD